MEKKLKDRIKYIQQEIKDCDNVEIIEALEDEIKIVEHEIFKLKTNEIFDERLNFLIKVFVDFQTETNWEKGVETFLKGKDYSPLQEIAIKAKVNNEEGLYKKNYINKLKSLFLRK